MKKILLFTVASLFFCNFLLADPQPKQPKPPENFDVHKHDWLLILDDSSTIIFIEPSASDMDESGKGAMLFRVIYTHPEQNVEKATGKKLMSLVGVLVVDCKEKQYTFLVVQAIFDDNSVETFSAPPAKDVKMKTVTEEQIKHPDTYITAMFRYVYGFYKAGEENKEHAKQHQEHLNKDGKMII